MQGWVTSTNALPGFSISHAVLDGSEWVDGNGRTLLVIPGSSPSAEEAKLSHHPLSRAVGSTHGNTTDLPVLVFLGFSFLFPPVLVDFSES